MISQIHKGSMQFLDLASWKRYLEALKECLRLFQVVILLVLKNFLASMPSPVMDMLHECVPMGARACKEMGIRDPPVAGPATNCSPLANTTELHSTLKASVHFPSTTCCVGSDCAIKRACA